MSEVVAAGMMMMGVREPFMKTKENNCVGYINYNHHTKETSIPKHIQQLYSVQYTVI